ncbi:MAG TPA: hypothetical protein VL463_28270 [Kofleriaceae bacterium]|nr:hypothetical protein [Kofleriaceae bacterium]
MKRLALLVLALAACDEKMTPEKCVSIWSRAVACTDPDVKTVPDKAEPSFLDDALPDLCKDDQMMQAAREAAACMNKSSSCADFRACWKQPSIVPSFR